MQKQDAPLFSISSGLADRELLRDRCRERVAEIGCGRGSGFRGVAAFLLAPLGRDSLKVAALQRLRGLGSGIRGRQVQAQLSVSSRVRGRVRECQVRELHVSLVESLVQEQAPRSDAFIIDDHHEPPARRQSDTSDGSKGQAASSAARSPAKLGQGPGPWNTTLRKNPCQDNDDTTNKAIPWLATLDPAPLEIRTQVAGSDQRAPTFFAGRRAWSGGMGTRDPVQGLGARRTDKVGECRSPPLPPRGTMTEHSSGLKQGATGNSRERSSTLSRVLKTRKLHQASQGCGQGHVPGGALATPPRSPSPQPKHACTRITPPIITSPRPISFRSASCARSTGPHCACGDTREAHRAASAATFHAGKNVK